MLILIARLSALGSASVKSVHGGKLSFDDFEFASHRQFQFVFIWTELNKKYNSDWGQCEGKSFRCHKRSLEWCIVDLLSLRAASLWLGLLISRKRREFVGRTSDTFRPGNLLSSRCRLYSLRYALRVSSFHNRTKTKFEENQRDTLVLSVEVCRPTKLIHLVNTVVCLCLCVAISGNK